MNEDTKIAEADYFLQRLIKTAPRDPVATRFETSAFLSAARSALQYARDEASSKSGGQSWYDTAVGVDPVVKFLKDSRDINIHVEPVPMHTNTTITVGPAHLGLSGTVSTVVLKRGDDQTIEWTPKPPQLPPLPARQEPSVTSHAYKFNGWAGLEDVPTLCTRYLTEVTRIIAEGRSLGFLTS